LVSEQGYRDAGFEILLPGKRRRNCYRIDPDHMYIEVTRGRSEIYDVLTHLTFMYMEAEKIRRNVEDERGLLSVAWNKLTDIIEGRWHLTPENQEQAFAFLSNILGRTLEETRIACGRLSASPSTNNGIFHVVYNLGKIAMDRAQDEKIAFREISFTPTLRERIGHHIYGEKWADAIKHLLYEKNLLDRPLHIISSNLHSVMNSLYGFAALAGDETYASIEDMAMMLSDSNREKYRAKVQAYAREHGMYTLDDFSGTNITVQVIDTAGIPLEKLPSELSVAIECVKAERPVLIIMDYAFGEQAYETLDELLKPFEHEGEDLEMHVKSISIMGKAGVLQGDKGDIMLPTAHVFEGTADNYPFTNEFTPQDFAGFGGNIYQGPMITVLGTSLQNRDVLAYFRNSSWRAIGLEMEGAHYQKAIQAQAHIRGNIQGSITLRYAYYASDNPLVTGSTLASGSLGRVGVRPTYLITRKILDKILE